MTWSRKMKMSKKSFFSSFLLNILLTTFKPAKGDLLPFFKLWRHYDYHNEVNMMSYWFFSNFSVRKFGKFQGCNNFRKKVINYERLRAYLTHCGRGARVGVILTRIYLQSPTKSFFSLQSALQKIFQFQIFPLSESR